MKIVVCVKQVPDVTELRFDAASRTIIREGVPAVMNPFDKPALAAALRIKAERGAAAPASAPTVTAVTMGPPAAREVLYEALAAGCDEAVHLCDPALAGSDTLATARALGAALRRLGADLVLCGKYTIDGETAQVGPELAELLGVPHVSGVGKLSWEDEGTLLCERESDDGHEHVRVALPCLLTCAEHLLPPVPVRRPQLEAARQRIVEVLGAADLGLSPSEVGLGGSPTWVAEIQQLPKVERPPVRLLRGETEEVARELAAALRAAIAERPAREAAPLPAPGGGGGGAVAVVVERDGAGALRPGTRELLGEAAALASQLGGEAVALCLGAPGTLPDALALACGEAGADAVLSIEHEALSPYDSEAYAAALCEAIAALRPAAVLFSSTERGRDLAPRAAARLGLGLTGDAIGLRLDEERRLVQLKPAFGGNFVAPILSRTSPAMATVRPGVIAPRRPDPSRRPRRQVLRPASLVPGRARLLREDVTVDGRAARLGSARVVIGVGHGIGGPEQLPLIYRLAEALGAGVCATRRVTDKGWMPRQLQVGLTGRVIAPDVYLAIGVRGAPYHSIGIQRAGAIFSVNSDEKAPILQLARVGAVLPFEALGPALLQALAQP